MAYCIMRLPYQPGIVGKGEHMTHHATVRPDKKEHGAGGSIGRGATQNQTVVETNSQRPEPVTGGMLLKKAISPISTQSQYGIALGSILVAFLTRLVGDFFLDDSMPFVTFLIATAVTTWYGGIGASLTALILGAMVWNWFFVSPRYEFSMGDHIDQAGLTIYTLIGVAIIGYTQTWRWALKQGEQREQHVQSGGVPEVNSKFTHHT